MSHHLILDKDYTNWIADLSKRYRSAQIKAAISVNEELLKFYWFLGRDIVERQAENKYGKGFFNTLSRDLKAALPEAKCFSPKNLYYIRRFYLMYPRNFPQAGGNFISIEIGNHNQLKAIRLNLTGIFPVFCVGIAGKF